MTGAPPASTASATASPTATTSSRLPALSPQAVHATLHSGARPDRIERARGSLLGLAMGDALVVSLADAAQTTAVPAELEGGGPEDLPPGAWTDETAMALSQADSLLACQGVDTRDQADRYLRWLREGHRSATGTAAGVRPELRRLLALAAARRSALTGVHDPRVLDSEPLARCAPAAIYYGDDLEAAVEAGADAARITHQAPVLVDACRLFTALIHTALAGADRPTVLAHALEWDGVLKPEVMAVADGWVAAATPAKAAPRRPRGAILAMLDAVVRAFAQAPDFRSGLASLLAQPAGRGEPDVAAAGVWPARRRLVRRARPARELARPARAGRRDRRRRRGAGGGPGAARRRVVRSRTARTAVPIKWRDAARPRPPQPPPQDAARLDSPVGRGAARPPLLRPEARARRQRVRTPSHAPALR